MDRLDVFAQNISTLDPRQTPRKDPSGRGVCVPGGTDPASVTIWSSRRAHVRSSAARRDSDPGESTSVLRPRPLGAFVCPAYVGSMWPGSCRSNAPGSFPAFRSASGCDVIVEIEEHPRRWTRVALHSSNPLSNDGVSTGHRRCLWQSTFHHASVDRSADRGPDLAHVVAGVLKVHPTT